MVLMDERISTLQGGYLALVVVDADDIVAHLCKADSCDQADIAGADDGDLNWLTHMIRGYSLCLLSIADSSRLRSTSIRGQEEPSRQPSHTVCSGNTGID